MTAHRNKGARSRNHFCRGKVINITYSECVSVALVIQHGQRMRRIILSFVDCLAVPSFTPHYLNKWHDFRKKDIEHNVVLRLPLELLSEIFLILKRNQRGTIIHVHRCSREVTVILVRV